MVDRRSLHPVTVQVAALPRRRRAGHRAFQITGLTRERRLVLAFSESAARKPLPDLLTRLAQAQ